MCASQPSIVSWSGQRATVQRGQVRHRSQPRSYLLALKATFQWQTECGRACSGTAHSGTAQAPCACMKASSQASQQPRSPHRAHLRQRRLALPHPKLGQFIRLQTGRDWGWSWGRDGEACAGRARRASRAAWPRVQLTGALPPSCMQARVSQTAVPSDQCSATLAQGARRTCMRSAAISASTSAPSCVCGSSALHQH